MTTANRVSIRARWAALAAAAAVTGLVGFGVPEGAQAEEGVKAPPPMLDESPKQSASETAVVAGGCFWGVQGVFQHMKGVKNAVSGYAGGAQNTAEYETVSSGSTGHAESVKITYDPKQTSFGQILQVYFSVAHDPTELNRQGPDTGTQYRSTVFAQTPEQAEIAKAYIAQLDKAKLYSSGKIVTTIESGKAFYPAEAYHQDFLVQNPRYPYIVFNDLPKIENFKKLMPSVYRDKPALVSEASASN